MDNIWRLWLAALFMFIAAMFSIAGLIAILASASLLTLFLLLALTLVWYSLAHSMKRSYNQHNRKL